MATKSAVQTKAPAVTMEQFRKDISDIYLFYARNAAWVDSTAAQKLFPDLEIGELLDPDQTVAELGFGFERIAHTEYAEAMVSLYDFAYFSRVDATTEAIPHDESIYAWATALTYDAAHSRAADMWEGYGVDILEPAKRCLSVAELANARAVLEGPEHFFRFRESEEEGMGALTVRQFALLADMEEMSIRAAANPRRANPLKTYSENGRTLIEPGVAKEWLKSKGRYAPITRYWGAGDIDLNRTRFSCLSNLEYAVSARLAGMEEKEGQGALREKLSKLGFKAALEPGQISIEIGNPVPPEQSLRDLARLSGLDPNMFLLRVKEVVALEQLAEVRRELELVLNQKQTVASV